VIGSIASVFVGGGHNPSRLPLQASGGVGAALRRRAVGALYSEECESWRDDGGEHSADSCHRVGGHDRSAVGSYGYGRGIFLSPLLLFTGWVGTKPTSGASAAFILANSVAGLAGNVASARTYPKLCRCGLRWLRWGRSSERSWVLVGCRATAYAERWVRSSSSPV
jgi:hypothetical protein